VLLSSCIEITGILVMVAGIAVAVVVGISKSHVTHWAAAGLQAAKLLISPISTAW
jgi:hypothetical protein